MAFDQALQLTSLLATPHGLRAFTGVHAMLYAHYMLRVPVC